MKKFKEGLSVTSCDKNFLTILEDIKKDGFKISSLAREMMESLFFEQFMEPGGITYNLKILLGREISKQNGINSSLHYVTKEAAKNGLRKPRGEVALLLLSMLSVGDFKKMKITKLVVMHDPYNDFDGRDGGPSVLAIVIHKEKLALVTYDTKFGISAGQLRDIEEEGFVYALSAKQGKRDVSKFLTEEVNRF